MAGDGCGDAVDGNTDEDGGEAEEEDEGDFAGGRFGLVGWQVGVLNRRLTVSWAWLIG